MSGLSLKKFTRVPKWVRALALMGLVAAVSLASACLPGGGGEGSGSRPSTSIPSLTEPAPENGKEPFLQRGLPGKRQERLMLASSSGDLNLDPFARTPGLFPVDSSGFCQTLYETLLVYAPDTFDYQPLMARRIHVLDREIRIELPEKKAWQDGQPVTGSDLVFSLTLHQALKTEAGLALEKLVESMELAEDDRLILRLNQEEMAADLGCLDALSRALIVPKHLWEPLLDDLLADGRLDEEKIPRIGSGPWTFVQEDEYSLSFSLDPGSPAYVSFLKYRQPVLSRQALFRGELDMVFFSGPDESLHDPVWGEGGRDLLPLICGEREAGISLNPLAQNLLTQRSFRLLLGQAVDPDISGPILMPLGPSAGRPLPPTPGVAGKDLVDDLGLVRSSDEGWLEEEGRRLPALRLLYPRGSGRVEEVCRYFQEEARKLGIEIILKSLEEDEWARAYREGNYELIFSQGSVNESPARLLERYLYIPGLAQEVGGSTEQFDLDRGRQLTEKLAVSKGERAIRSALEDLSAWSATEGLFIRLASGPVEAAAWNPESAVEVNPSSLFPQGAYWKDPAS